MYLCSEKIITQIAMLSDDKITEIYYMADDLCKFFSGNVKKHTIEENDGKDTRTDLYACRMPKS